MSNVVRRSDVVAAPTRKKVLAAIAKLGYRPNALARQLVRWAIVAHGSRRRG